MYMLACTSCRWEISSYCPFPAGYLGQHHLYKHIIILVSCEIPTDIMANQDLTYSASIQLQQFVESTKAFKNVVCVKLYAKRQDYGLKLYIVVRDAKNNSTIINTFMKVCSAGQLRILRCTLKSIKSSITHYMNDICEAESGTDIVNIN